jgi:hypothetical protein
MSAAIQQEEAAAAAAAAAKGPLPQPSAAAAVAPVEQVTQADQPILLCALCVRHGLRWSCSHDAACLYVCK